MGVIQFRIGRRHAKHGMPYLTHRNGRRYDGASDNDSYLHGYKYGLKEREEKSSCDSHEQEKTNV